MSNIILSTGDLVYYRGPPIYYPQLWAKIIANNNGVVDSNEIAIILENDNFLRIATVYFQQNEIEIPRLSHKFLIKVE